MNWSGQDTSDWFDLEPSIAVASLGVHKVMSASALNVKAKRFKREWNNVLSVHI